MNGVCQTCGATAPLEWFLTTAKDRACMEVIKKLPKEISHHVLHYLSLFRPDTGRSITPARAQKLLTELEALVATRYVQVQGKVARPCSPAIWAQAMEDMIEKRDRLSQLKNHNYLRQVAWDLADKADAAIEKKLTTAERTHSSLPDRDDEDMGDFDLNAHLKEFKGKNPQFDKTTENNDAADQG